MVFFFLICIAFGKWQQSEEISLPKGIQVNDLAITNSGELWILSSSSILKYEAATKSPHLIQGFTEGKIFAIIDEQAYIVDKNNKLIALNLTDDGLYQQTDLILNSPDQIGTALAGNKPFVVIQELDRLTFIRDNKVLSSINSRVERFTTIPLADYDDKLTPVYTLANNRIYSWTGGTIQTAEGYKSKLIFSASNKILDFVVDQNGDLFILFSDSIVVLESTGEYISKVSIDNIPLGSKILSNPASSKIIVFDRLQKSLKVLTGINKSKTGELITLNNNQPNPVDNHTEIGFAINQSLNLTITIYNLIGEPVKIIAKGRYPKGTHRVTWHADDEKGSLVPNGIYFYRLESNKGVAIKQLIVLR